MWKLFSKKLQIILPEYSHERLNPSPEDMAYFEDKFSFAFPDAYRQFVFEIGTGEFNSNIWVIGPTRDNKDHDLVRWTKRTVSNQTLKDIYSDPELIAALIPFANTVYGDIIGWDRRKKSGKDYAIAVLPRHVKKPKSLNLTFKAYLEKACQASTKELGKNAKLDKGKQFEFRPFTKRKK